MEQTFDHEEEPIRVRLPFDDRAQAGRVLARRLRSYRDRDDVLVLALPRGGVPVAAEVAREIRAPLDVLLVRKLGYPGQEELAVGAVAVDGIRVLNPEIAHALSSLDLAKIVGRERRELERRERLYRDGRPFPNVHGRIVILVDDGLATGATMRAAIRVARKKGAARVIVAAPVAASDTVLSLRSEADDIVCAATPEPLHAVGIWYRDFRQVTDDAVRDLLSPGWRGLPAAPRTSRVESPALLVESGGKIRS